MAVPTRAERDANLDALKEAIDAWSEAEINRVDSETRFLRTVLQSRNATIGMARNLAEGSLLLQDELDAFLAFTDG